MSPDPVAYIKFPQCKIVTEQIIWRLEIMAVRHSFMRYSIEGSLSFPLGDQKVRCPKIMAAVAFKLALGSETKLWILPSERWTYSILYSDQKLDLRNT